MAITCETLEVKDATGTEQSIPVHLDALDNIVPTRSADTTLATYSLAATMAAADIAATPTDIVVLRGSATKTVRLKKVGVKVWWDTGAAGLAVPIALKKHTTANTAGTSTTPTPVQFDSGDAAASAVVLQYSANPTITGTPVSFASLQAGTLALETVSGAEWSFLDFEHAMVLRGVAQEVAINLAGFAGTQTGLNIAYEIVWSEEDETP